MMGIILRTRVWQREVKMAVKVLIDRKVPHTASAELSSLIKELRKRTIRQPGYISGETLKRVDEPGEILVIATWQTVDDYMKWVFSKERAEIQEKIDAILGTETVYKVYQYD